LVSDQRNYLVQTVKEITNITRTIFQVIALVAFRSFYLYLAVESVCIFANNFIVSAVVDRKYKYVRQQKNDEKLRSYYGYAL
jgi:hypothetical protein